MAPNVRAAPSVASLSEQHAQAWLAEHIAMQAFDDVGLHVFTDWDKGISDNGFDFIAYDKNTGQVWLVDNKAYSKTIAEATSLEGTAFTTNMAEARRYLERQTSAEGIAALEALESGSYIKVVTNALSKGNAGFSEKLFAKGIQVFEVRLYKLFASRAAWLADMQAAGLVVGVRRFTKADRILGRQRGFATVGSLIFVIVVVGTTVLALKESDDIPMTLLTTAADFVVVGVVYRLAGSTGMIALSVLELCSDDAEMQKRCEEEDAAKVFIRKYFPGSVKKRGIFGGDTDRSYLYVEEFDPTLLKEAVDFIFHTEPIVIPQKSSPAPASGMGRPNPGPPPKPPVSKDKQMLDDYVEKHQAQSMEGLIAALKDLTYAKLKETRDWYASGNNPKKGLWGLRPQVAMDAVLHQNEGVTAGWILNECEQAEIFPTPREGKPDTSDQYRVIKKTIGMEDL